MAAQWSSADEKPEHCHCHHFLLTASAHRRRGGEGGRGGGDARVVVVVVGELGGGVGVEGRGGAGEGAQG